MNIFIIARNKHRHHSDPWWVCMKCCLHSVRHNKNKNNKNKETVHLLTVGFTSGKTSSSGDSTLKLCTWDI